MGTVQEIIPREYSISLSLVVIKKKRREEKSRGSGDFEGEDSNKIPLVTSTTYKTQKKKPQIARQPQFS